MLPAARFTVHSVPERLLAMPTEEGSKAIHTGALKSISRQTRRINSQYEILYVNSREVVNGSVQSLGKKNRRAGTSWFRTEGTVCTALLTD